MQIIVLGMHRSGTSLTTRIINMMGAYFAPKNLWLPANSDNPEGFWERTDVLAINRALMQAQGCSWHHVGAWDDTNITVPAAARQAITNTLGEMNAHLPWVMKDPRLCLTLPGWLPYLKSPVAVIASRNPLEIARSLEIRNQMPMEYGLALWEYHAVGIIRHAASLPKVFTRYDAMLAQPVETAFKLCDDLSEHVTGLALPARNDILEFIKPDLKRARADTSHALTSQQQTLQAMLQGKLPFDSNVQVSNTSKDIMKRLGDKISGAPAAH